MNERNHTRPTIWKPGQAVLGLLLVVFFFNLAGAAAANSLAVPAEFIRDIRIPGLGETILRPTSLHFDKFHDEILVGDSGNNRIVIFGASGVYKFDFSLTEIMTTPRDISTDPEGYIYVLGSDPSGQVLYRFDFDGTPLQPIPVPMEHEGLPVEFRNLAHDDQGNLFALDHLGRRILALDRDGTVGLTINLEMDSDVQARLAGGEVGGEGAFALGALTCADGVLYVPVSNAGTVLRFATDGHYIGSVGAFGAKTGFLNFPVDVEVSPEGLILVLDKPRFCIPCFSPDGRFLGEFGGKGIRPGWFMGPSLLAVSSHDRVVVGQIFRSKIQVCEIPEFIRAKQNREPTGPETEGAEISSASDETGRLFVDSPRRLSENFRPIGSQGGEFPSPISNNARTAQNVSLPEVSK